MPERWSYLTLRLRRAALVTHPGAIAVVELALSGAMPYAVTEWVDGASLEETYADWLPLAEGELLPIAVTLADTLAHAHGIGLAHGMIEAKTVRMRSNRRCQLDFTQLATMGDAPQPDKHATRATDLRQLGRLLYWLGTGQHDCDSTGKQGNESPLWQAIHNLLSQGTSERMTASRISRELMPSRADARSNATNVD